jgi:hypothetical protein
MKKIIFSFLFTFLLCQFLLAQVKDSKGQAKRQFFLGTVLQKPWTKSSQSYCAQGSDYFILKTSKNQEWVLENPSEADLANFANKKVKITGFMRTKKIEADDNVNLQRPIEYDINGNEVKDAGFTCEVLVITKIELK